MTYEYNSIVSFTYERLFVFLFEIENIFLFKPCGKIYIYFQNKYFNSNRPC